jgi:ATP-binding cassette subfamily B protein RaxB
VVSVLSFYANKYLSSNSVSITIIDKKLKELAMTINTKKYGNKLPKYIQNDPAECGIACMAMISSFFGRREDIGSIKRQFPLHLKNSDLSSILELAHKLGLTPRPIRLEPVNIKNLSLPSILHWELDHYVVLCEVKRDGVIINDPAHGQRYIPFDDLNNSFTGVAIELQASSEFITGDFKTPIQVNELVQIGRYFSTKYFSVVTLELMKLLTFSVIIFFVFQLSKNLFESPDTINTASATFTVGGLYFLYKWLSAFKANVFNEHVKQSESRIVVGLFSKLIHLPLIYFDNRKNSNVAAPLKAFEAIKPVLAKVVSLPIDIISLFIVIAMAFYVNPIMTLITLSAILVISLIMFLGNRVYEAESNEIIKRDGNYLSKTQESISLIRQIKIYQQENSFIRKFYNAVEDNTSIHNIKQRTSTKVKVLTSWVYALELTLLLMVALTSLVQQQSFLATIMVFFILRQELVKRALLLTKSVIEFSYLPKHLNTISELIIEKAEFSTAKSIEKLPATKLSLSGRNILFRYAEDKPILFENVNIDIEAGKMLSIVSAPGRGKSTLLRILAGLVTPNEGTLAINDVDLNLFGSKNFRDNIAYVSQNEKIFIGTILDNVSLFDENPDFEKYERCLALVNLTAGIAELPMGSQTVVHEGQLKLEQVQKIGIARALYKVPKFLFLDEATAFCEDIEEQRIMSNIKDTGITCISVAHRRSAIYVADKIFHLDTGKYVEKYTPETHSWR